MLYLALGLFALVALISPFPKVTWLLQKMEEKQSIAVCISEQRVSGKWWCWDVPDSPLCFENKRRWTQSDGAEKER